MDLNAAYRLLGNMFVPCQSMLAFLTMGLLYGFLRNNSIENFDMRHALQYWKQQLIDICQVWILAKADTDFMTISCASDIWSQTHSFLPITIESLVFGKTILRMVHDADLGTDILRLCLSDNEHQDNAECFSILEFQPSGQARDLLLVMHPSGILILQHATLTAMLSTWLNRLAIPTLDQCLYCFNVLGHPLIWTAQGNEHLVFALRCNPSTGQTCEQWNFSVHDQVLQISNTATSSDGFLDNLRASGVISLVQCCGWQMSDLQTPCNGSVSAVTIRAQCFRDMSGPH